MVSGILVLAGAAVPGGLSAQEAGGGAADSARRAPPDTARYDLEELVVTANRAPVPLRRVPSRVDVISGEELRARGIHFVSRALRGLAGTSFSSQGPYGGVTSLFMRGGESDYVQVLVDGIPVNDPGGSFDFAHLTADDVERVEVMRGPGSVLYGSDAMTGVIQIFTRDGRGPSSARSGLRGGTYGSLVLDAGVSGGGPDASYSFEFSRFTSDGLRAFNNDYRNVTGTGRFRVVPDDRTEAGITLRYTDSRYHFPTDGAGRLVDENQFQDRDGTVLGVDLRRELGPTLDARLRVSTYSSNTAFDDAPDGPADTTGVFAFESQGDLDRHRGEITLSYRPDAATRILFGGSLEEAEERSSSRSRSAFGTSASSSLHDRWNRALYLQTTRDVGGWVTLTGGVRVDDNEEFGFHDTYRLGAAVHPTETTRIRAAFGTGFKAPTFFENFATGFAKGNPALTPESTKSWEAGLEQEIPGAGLRLAATYFDQSFDDLIQFTFSPPQEGDPNFFNVGAADVRGLELEASLPLADELQVAGSYTYLDTEVVDAGFQQDENDSFVEGERLLRRPTHSASLEIAVRPLDRARISTAARWVGDRADRDFGVSPVRRVVLDDYLTVDLSSRFVLISGGSGRPEIAPTLRVENLFDGEYREVAGFPARGRTLIVGLETDLGL